MPNGTKPTQLVRAASYRRFRVGHAAKVPQLNHALRSRCPRYSGRQIRVRIIRVRMIPLRSASTIQPPATFPPRRPPPSRWPLLARLCEVGRGAAWRREQSVSAVCVCVWASLFRCGEWRGQSRGGRDSVGITQLVLAASAFLSRLLALTQRTPLGGSPLRADSPKKN